MTLVRKNKCILGPLPPDTSDEDLYNYFIKYIYQGDLKINGMNIKVFTTPIEDNRMQGYFHLTTKTQKQFKYKIRMKEARAFFINYIPLMINNYMECSSCLVENCSKIKIWTAPYKQTKRTKLLYSDDNYSYLIVLEQNKKEMFIVTSFLIDEPHYLNKILAEYEKYKKASK